MTRLRRVTVTPVAAPYAQTQPRPMSGRLCLWGITGTIGRMVRNRAFIAAALATLTACSPAAATSQTTNPTSTAVAGVSTGDAPESATPTGMYERGNVGRDEASAWRTKWCEAEPGMSQDQLVAIMGMPTLVMGNLQHPERMSWDAYNLYFAADMTTGGTAQSLSYQDSQMSPEDLAAMKCEWLRSVK